jgi:hypothetical protein
VNKGFEHRNRWVIVVLIVALLPSAACRGTSEEAGAEGNEPARVEPVEGTDVSRVILTARAVERLGIRTATVQNGEGRQAELTVMPYSALVYDTNGRAWAYASPEQLTFVRSPLTIERIEEQNVFLLDGPPPGTRVVTVGAAELYGTELGIE